MDTAFRDRFIDLWHKHFPDVDLPIAFYYTEDKNRGEPIPPPEGHRCMVGVIARARKGKSILLDCKSVGCTGGERYCGFTESMMPDFEYFLSYGIPGQMEGERYKKSPEIVQKITAKMPTFTAPAPYILFKRWDRLDPVDSPEVVIFFAEPDVIAGLFTLAGFDEIETDSVIAPFGAGCATIVQYPYLEQMSDTPRAVMGMFDISARPCVPKNELTFAVPMKKFESMAGNMDESFLITPSWAAVKKRIGS